jgi:hypothetical protein
MTKQDPDPDLDKRCIEGRGQGLAGDSEAVCCPPQERGAAGWLGRRE